MNRRLAIVLAVFAAAGWLAALGASSHAHPHAAPADPLADVAPAPAPPAPSTLHLCLDGPTFAAAVAPGADLAERARLAFALLRTAERAGAIPALPQRVGTDLATPARTCVDIARPR